MGWRRATYSVMGLVLLAGTPVAAQEHPEHPPAEEQPPEHDHLEAPGPLGIPITRNASGTSWQPDVTPMHGIHLTAGAWTLMPHWSVFAGYDRQGSRRGDGQFFSTNWGMLMALRELGGGELLLRAMLSLEPFTVGERGYPLLLQTGETFGERLHDRQHPHDLFMEVAASYQRALGGSVGFQVYLAPVGEPALGPVAYPHRLSALPDPLAPLGHHWEDSTHISFGVITAGLFTRHVKLEGSWFNGREPDEERLDFDLRVPNSYSVRLSLNPLDRTSFQLSYGFLSEPELIEPGVDVQRITGSATYTLPLGGETHWSSSLVVGANVPTEGPWTQAVLLESAALLGPNELFGRFEYVRKAGEDLVLGEELEDAVFPIATLALGYVRNLGTFANVVPGIGVRGAINLIGSGLEPFYGTRLPAGFAVFVRVIPAEMGR